jgi:hypothetical protein
LVFRSDTEFALRGELLLEKLDLGEDGNEPISVKK